MSILTLIPSFSATCAQVSPSLTWNSRAWSIIQPIVTAANGGAFNPEARGQLIREAVQRGGSKKHVYRYLRRYWQAGMTPNALLPHFHLCGGRGKERKAGKAKRGRPRTLTKLKGAPPGINIGPAEAEKLRKGFRKHYEKTPEQGGCSLRESYERTLQEYFHRGYEHRNGVLVPVLPPASDLPSFAQYLYWARRTSDIKRTIIRRVGERRFNLKSRAVLGDATLSAFGPGSLVQIDCTPSDVWVVSALDRSRRLGRPTVYFVVDSFSHLICGFYAGLEDPSFFAAGLALENATLDKPSFCRQYKIEILAEEWPSYGLPEAILADRGELEGHGASNLVQSLGIRVANTSPYRADLKPIVERTFRSMNDLLIHKLPGGVRKPKERGERDPRLEAVLTLHEFKMLLIHSMVLHNGRRIENYPLQPAMITDGVEPRPVDLWAWGIRNRSGHLRTADPVIVRSNLLPGGRATVTHRGIKFRGLHYSCERALIEHWFEKARATKSWPIDVTYDPRLTDTIFIRAMPPSIPEACQLLDVDQRFRGLTWCDFDDFLLASKEAREASTTADLQSRVNFGVQVEAVVANAVERAAAANGGLTKAARLRDVSKNRKEERRLESAAAQPTPTPAVAKEPATFIAGGSADDPYIPPSSPLEMLRKQREAKWSANE